MDRNKRVRRALDPTTSAALPLSQGVVERYFRGAHLMLGRASATLPGQRERGPRANAAALRR